MQIICVDGTTIQCAAFRPIDSGVLLFEDESDEDLEDREADGFVPLSQLQYVLPEDFRMQPRPQGQPIPQQQGGQLGPEQTGGPGYSSPGQPQNR